MRHWLFIIALACAIPAAAAGPAALQEDLAAWQRFCEALRAQGERVIASHPQVHGIDRAEGLIYLTQQLAAAVDATLYRRASAVPLLRQEPALLRKSGMDGADARYLQAALDEHGVYRLHGRLGNAALIALQTARTAPAYTGLSALAGAALEADAEGRVDIALAARRPAGWQGAWLRLDPGADTLFIREYFAEWRDGMPSRLMLERLDPVAPLPAPAPAEARRLLAAMAEEFGRRGGAWVAPAAATRRDLVNRLRNSPPSPQGLATNRYGRGWFQLRPDEALLIEFEPPRALLWSFQLGNAWWESLDYVTAAGSLNARQAVAGSDGRYRLVVAGRDPGVPNWLDTGGRAEGMIFYRYQESADAPVPEARVVPLAGLADALPPDTPRVTPAQRAEALSVRRRHVGRRWSP